MGVCGRVPARERCHLRLWFKHLFIERFLPAPCFTQLVAGSLSPCSFIVQESKAQRGAGLRAKREPELDLNPKQLWEKSEPLAFDGLCPAVQVCSIDGGASCRGDRSRQVFF